MGKICQPSGSHSKTSEYDIKTSTLTIPTGDAEFHTNHLKLNSQYYASTPLFSLSSTVSDCIARQRKNYTLNL